MFYMSKLLFLLSSFLLFQNYLNAQTNMERRTKLCADPKCTEDLFPSLSIRDYASQDPQFLQHKQNSSLKVFAFKFSNRPDFMEAETVDKKRGFIYNGHIDLEPYVVFLESALKTNKTLYMVDQENGKLIREVSAIPELVMDYSTYALKIEGYPLDKELMNKLMALEREPTNVHKHNHHGHGHGHSHDEHGHHEHAHHSNSQEQKNEEIKKAEPINSIKIEQMAEKTKSAQDIIAQQQEKGETNQPKEATTIEDTNSQEVMKQQKILEENVQQNNKKPPPSDTEEKTANEQQKRPINDEIEKAKEQMESPPQIAENEKQNAEGNEQTKQMQQNEQEKFENQKIEQQGESKSPPEIQKPQIIIEPMEDEKIKMAEKIELNEEKMKAVPMQNNGIFANESQKVISQEEAIVGEEKPPKIAGQNSMMNDPILKNVINSQAPPQQQQEFGGGPPLPIISQEQSNDNNGKMFGGNDQENNPKEQPIVPAEIVPSAIPPPPPPPILFETPAAKMEEQLERSNEEQKLPENEKNFGGNLNILQSSNVVVEAAENGVQNKEFTGEGENTKITAAGIDESSKPLDSNVENDEKINYCYKEDCGGLDQIPSADKKPPSAADSKIYKMYRETMSTIRAFLPEPMCHFEDSGLIMLAAILILATIHFTNVLLLSKSSGPEPFDHRLLHDCITRLKEQELVIEQQRTKVAENQHLLGAARAAEQLQKENKILAERVKTADGRNSELDSDNERMKKLLKGINEEVDRNRKKIESLATTLAERDVEIKHVDSSRSHFETELGQNVEKLAKSQQRVAHLEAELENGETLNAELAIKLSISQKEAEKLDKECEEKKAEIDALLGIIAELNGAAMAGGSRRGSKRGSSAEIEEIPEEKKTKKVGGKEKKNGDTGTSSSSSPNSSPGQDDGDNGVGSGGSAGWSDLGDGIEATGIGAEVVESNEEKDSPTKSKEARGGQQQKSRKKLLSPSEMEKRIVEEEEEMQQQMGEVGNNAKLMDILEMAKLKSKLRSLETEREQLKFSLKVEKEEKENAQKEMQRLRQELAEKDRESEKRELDRHGLTQQCTKLLHMIEEKERKMEHSDQERERIRIRLADVELELRKVEDDKREMQHRLKEVEQSLKRSDELNGRLENKLYHEERKFNNKIRQLEEQLSLAKSSLSPMNLSGGGLSSDLNMSGNSSDREFLPFNGPGGGNANLGGGGIGRSSRAAVGREGGESRSGVASLWSEIDATEPIEELAQLERQGGSMRRRRSIRTHGESSNRNSPYLTDLVHISSTGREERLMNTSKYSAASSAAAAGALPRQQMRSRSVGRQSARLTGVSAASTANPSFYGTIGSSASLYNTSSAALAHHRADRASVVPMLARTRQTRNNEDAS